MDFWVCWVYVVFHFIGREHITALPPEQHVALMELYDAGM
jgi:hypothetical protein